MSSHRRFGTAKWRLDLKDKRLLEMLKVAVITVEDFPSVLDFVSARTEFYTHPTALPSVERSSIKLDLHRRDFTINTLALRLDGRYYGQLLDHWGGGRDLRDQQIRVLHSLSFVDDPTRMLRAVRLEQRLGFDIESRTLELLEQALPLLGRVSGERIRNEFIQMFTEERLSAIMARLQELGLLTAIHPSLVWDSWLDERFRQVLDFKAPEVWRLHEVPPDESLLYSLLCIRLPLEKVREVCQRLHFPASMTAEILGATHLKLELPDLVAHAQPSELVAYLEEYDEVSVVAAWHALHDRENAREAIEHFLETWRFVVPKTDGDTLRALGLPPSPSYRHILQSLRAAWIDGDIKSEDEEKTLLQQLLEEVRSDG